MVIKTARNKLLTWIYSENASQSIKGWFDETERTADGFIGWIFQYFCAIFIFNLILVLTALKSYPNSRLRVKNTTPYPSQHYGEWGAFSATMNFCLIKPWTSLTESSRAHWKWPFWWITPETNKVAEIFCDAFSWAFIMRVGDRLLCKTGQL
jgi:hypothetical protein